MKLYNNLLILTHSLFINNYFLGGVLGGVDGVGGVGGVGGAAAAGGFNSGVVKYILSAIS